MGMSSITNLLFNNANKPAFQQYSYDNTLLSGFDFGSCLNGNMTFAPQVPYTIPTSGLNFGGIDFGSMLKSAIAAQNTWLNNFSDLLTAYLNKADNPDAAPEVDDKEDVTDNSEIRGNYSGDYTNANFDVTKPFDGTAEDLNKKLDGVMKGMGQTFLDLQEKYGINAAFLVSLANAESNHGKSNFAVNKNNVTSIYDSKNKQFRNFDTVADCLEYTAKLLKNNYVGEGLKTIAQIHQKYCPIGADNDPTGMNRNWGPTIAQLVTSIQNDTMA